MFCQIKVPPLRMYRGGFLASVDHYHTLEIVHRTPILPMYSNSIFVITISKMSFAGSNLEFSVRQSNSSYHTANVFFFFFFYKEFEFRPIFFAALFHNEKKIVEPGYKDTLYSRVKRNNLYFRLVLGDVYCFNSRGYRWRCSAVTFFSPFCSKCVSDPHGLLR